MAKIEFKNTFERKIIYIFQIPDDSHDGYLKIGDTKIDSELSDDELANNKKLLEEAADARISQYTHTATIDYNLVHVELAIYKKKDNNHEKTYYFRDHDVHRVLKRSGFKPKFYNSDNRNEWYEVDLETAKNAIKAVKEGRECLEGYQITQNLSPINWRPEQKEAIERTVKRFEKNNKMLWNAKMRFGKTLSALEVIKRCKFKKSIIITHRPDVNKGWFEDFNKAFYEPDNEYKFGSKTKGESIKNLLKTDKPFVYFASIQDLRGAIEVGGKFLKNDDIFKTKWDLVIIDEAHEGTQTELGQKVKEKLVRNDNKELSLSGTPFNLIDQYSEEETFTWDYIDEQEQKMKWYEDNDRFGDSNPYDDLPKMNIFTYRLDNIEELGFKNKLFEFNEFFRVWTGDPNKDLDDIPEGKKVGDFVHEDSVKAFLNLLCNDKKDTNYPYSKESYRNFFRHSLWMVPGVKEAAALEKLLNNHEVFGQFNIVNVAGDQKNVDDSDLDNYYKNEKNAYNKLREAIGDDPDDSYTITLSCDRLTTGVTVPEWTAVFMLKGSVNSDAKRYLQTIFRVQSPANINGRMKTDCYVFDFAPDRTLNILYDSIKISKGIKKKNSDEERVVLGKLLNFCPVISLSDSKMVEYDCEKMMSEIKKIYIQKVVDSGFDDTKIYNFESLNSDNIDLEEFEKLKKIIGKTMQTKKINDFNMNLSGLTEEERELLKKKKKKPLTKEQEEARRKRMELAKMRETAISILRGISIRIPLLVYGLPEKSDYKITIEEFANDSLIDEKSWKEFMPKDVTKEMFKKFIKYYDKDVFCNACMKIREMAKEADNCYDPLDRIFKITNIFEKFKNPDKETVLTPWNVVNLHMSETLGGYDFYKNQHLKQDLLAKPKFEETNITKDVYNDDCKLLEINSKTGLYPLYLAYTLYKIKVDKFDGELTDIKKQEIWDDIIKNNIFMICKTEMARHIATRTLVGYRDVKVNTYVFDDIINQFKNKENHLIEKILKPKTWNRKENGEMKFDAVVGNPPYQGNNHQQIYPYFYLTSIKLGNYVSLIFPTGWQEPKDANNLSKMNNKEVKYDAQIVFIDNRQNVFPGITGAEWTNIILWQKGYNNSLDGKQKMLKNGEFFEYKKLFIDKSEVKKENEIERLKEIIMNENISSFVSSITSSLKPYGLRTDYFDRPEYYKLKAPNETKISETDITIYGLKNRRRTIKYVDINYPLPKKTSAFSKFKIFIGKAWGGPAESYVGGSFSDIILARPYDICTENYIESGCFDNITIARKHAKYLMTKFTRALLYSNKISHDNSKDKWISVPLQDYSEDWWELSIDEINERLYEKYNIPQDIRDYIDNHIQPRSEENIVNF